MSKEQQTELKVAEMKMLWFELGVTRLDKIRYNLIRGDLHVEPIRNKVREARLRSYGHVKRRDHLGQKVLNMELLGKGKEAEQSDDIWTLWWKT